MGRLKHQEDISVKRNIELAATELFADFGYKNTTIRMIAQKADANIALINYYFGSKENLYAEIVNKWADDAFKKFPKKETINKNPEPWERLRILIKSTFSVLFEKNGKRTGFGRLIAAESSRTSPDFIKNIIVGKLKEPTEALFDIVADLSGITDLSEIKAISSLIIGQIVYFLLSQELINDLFHMPEKINENQQNKLTDLIVKYALDGLSGIKF